MTNVTLKELKLKILSHKKVKHIGYNQLLIQPYLNSHMSSEHKELLFFLRSQLVRGIKRNFSQMYQENSKCDVCKIREHTQRHILECPQILSMGTSIRKDIKYDHIYGSAILWHASTTVGCNEIF